MPSYASPPIPGSAVGFSSPPACRAAQLRLSADSGSGDFNGMSHTGVELSVRNLGPDCTLAALPKVELDMRGGRPAPAMRRPPPGMHPGPVMIPVRLKSGDDATTDLRWVSGPVYPNSRRSQVVSVKVWIGETALQASLRSVIYGRRGTALTFDQTPMRRSDRAPES